MLEKYIPKRFATAMIKHVIAATLFFPYIYSHNNNVYYQDFVLPNFFAILAMVFIFTSWKLDFKRNAIFVSGLGILLLAYNVCATYMNVKYHHWYGEQINTTISFLFFMVLLMVKDIHALIDTATIKATIHMIVASNVCAICFRLFTGFNRVILINDWLWLEKYLKSIQMHFAWLYSHKSEYGLLLVLCVAFFATKRKYFRNIFTYALSLSVLFVALYLSDSYTSMGAAILIFVGQFMDYLLTAKWWKKLIAVAVIPIPIILIIKEALQILSENRNTFTLNGRIYIWNAFLNLIKQYPNGITEIFGTNKYEVKDWGTWSSYATNAHNVFLNHAFRFSVPVGVLFTAICIIIVVFSIKNNFSFTTPCIWVALFIPLMMDNSLSPSILSYVLLLSFSIFFLMQRETVKE